MPKTTKMHPADAFAIDQIKSAVSFNVHLRLSPTAKINETATTLAEAAEIADRMRSVRPKARPMIYAITASGASQIVPADQVAGLIAEMPAPALEPNFPAEIRTVDAPSKPVEVPKKASNAGQKTGARAKIEADAASGILPAAPDFSAETHKPYRKKLGALVALAETGDVDGLRAFPINPVSSSPKALDKYRRLAITAIEARRA